MSVLFALFEAEHEPSPTMYKDSVSQVVLQPERIRDLCSENVKIHLAARTNRSTILFQYLQSGLSQHTSQKVNEVAAETSDMLLRLLPELHELIGTVDVTRPLAAALAVCFLSTQPTGLRRLAAVLCRCGSTLEMFATEPCGTEVFGRWVSLPQNLAFDVATQNTWTERLVAMVLSCPGDHDIAPALQRWEQLTALKKALRSLETRLLREENTRSTRPQTTKSALSMLDNDLKKLLSEVDLPIPGSRRMVQNHIETLSIGPTSSVLRSIVASLPCKHCASGLGGPPLRVNAELKERPSQPSSNLDIDIFGKSLGIWKVLLSDKALKSIQKIRMQGLFDPVEAKLTDLTSGHMTSKLAGSVKQREHLRVPLATTSCGQNASILWQVSVGPVGESQMQQQIMIIWEVGESTTISKALDRVIVLQKTYSEDHIHRCRLRPSISGDRLLPIQFDGLKFEVSQPTGPSMDFDVRTVEPETIQMAHKFHTLTEPVLNAIVANYVEAEFPFDLSSDEVKCIKHFKTSSLILGRSGTGKTTCLIFKLVGKFLASKAIMEERPIHQVSRGFLTAFPILAYTLKVLLTRSDVLAGKLKSYTQRLIKTLAARESSEVIQYEAQDNTMTESSQEHDSLLSLSDDSFPLVCSFDRFLRLLEKMALAVDRQNFSIIGNSSPFSSSSMTIQGPGPRQLQLIDFYTFRLDYWPRLPQMLTRSVSSNLVFAEIMGTIKGSCSSGRSSSPLSREEYLELSSRVAPNFVSDERPHVYDIFECYERLKQQRGDYDYVDRVVKLLKIVHEDKSFAAMLRTTFDEIFIDEIQDHRSVDVELLLNLVSNARGFHFAGDTAQTISQDSTFRFQDVKKMIYDHFSEAGTLTNQKQLGHAEMFLLSKNYRSHQGILSLASMVMDLIWKGFPETIDKLAPEIGALNGPRPVLFIGCDSNVFLASNVGSSKLSERSSDFGAEQVILVRDAAAKANLQREIGRVALIFTILESKGMEFDDVILWNFSTTCSDQAGIRSLNNLKGPNPVFDSKRFSGMCSELKHVYVAITRARIQLFIIETSETTGTLVEKLLTDNASGPLAEATRPTDGDFNVRVEMMRPNSSMDPVAWARRAGDLMQRHMFDDAIMAFHRAGDKSGEMKAQAFATEEKSRLCHAEGDMEELETNLEAAKSLFLQVGLVGNAIQVLARFGRTEKAARLCLAHNQYAKAATLFVNAGLFVEAVHSYHKAGEHGSAAALLRNKEQYDRLVSYLRDNLQHFSSADLRSYRLLCKLMLKQGKLSADHREFAINLLGSVKEQEACFLEYGMDDQLMSLYRAQARYTDLYQIYCRTGHLENALTLVFSSKLLSTSKLVSESEVLLLLDYSLSHHLMTSSFQSYSRKLRLNSTQFTPKIAKRIAEWEAIGTIHSMRGASAYGSFVKMEDSQAKRFFCLSRVFSKESLKKISDLDSLPFEVVKFAVDLTKDCLSNNDSGAWVTIMMVTGLWESDAVQTKYVTLPRSPLGKRSTELNKTDIRLEARQWVLDNIELAIEALDYQARRIVGRKWPERCAQYLMRRIVLFWNLREYVLTFLEFYPLNRRHSCQRPHADLTDGDISRMLQVTKYQETLARLC